MVRSLARTTLELPAAATFRSKPGVPPAARAMPLSMSTIAAPLAPSIASSSAMTLSSCATGGAPVPSPGGGRSGEPRSGSGGDPDRPDEPAVWWCTGCPGGDGAAPACVAPAGARCAAAPSAGGGAWVRGGGPGRRVPSAAPAAPAPCRALRYAPAPTATPTTRLPCPFRLRREARRPQTTRAPGRPGKPGAVSAGEAGGHPRRPGRRGRGRVRSGRSGTFPRGARRCRSAVASSTVTAPRSRT